MFNGIQVSQQGIAKD